MAPFAPTVLTVSALWLALLALPGVPGVPGASLAAAPPQATANPRATQALTDQAGAIRAGAAQAPGPGATQAPATQAPATQPPAAPAAPAGGAPPAGAVIERGREVYTYWCATCHSDGRGMPGTSSLAIKYRGTATPAVLEERTDLTPASVAFFVRNGVASMPFFRKTEISDADLAALSGYLSRPRQPAPVR